MVPRSSLEMCRALAWGAFEVSRLTAQTNAKHLCFGFRSPGCEADFAWVPKRASQGEQFREISDRCHRSKAIVRMNSRGVWACLLTQFIQSWGVDSACERRSPLRFLPKVLVLSFRKESGVEN